MASSRLNAVHEKVSGSSGGEHPKGPKKGGYAGPGIDDTLIGTKVGVTNKKKYSGPNVAQASRND